MTSLTAPDQSRDSQAGCVASKASLTIDGRYRRSSQEPSTTPGEVKVQHPRFETAWEIPRTNILGGVDQLNAWMGIAFLSHFSRNSPSVLPIIVRSSAFCSKCGWRQRSALASYSESRVDARKAARPTCQEFDPYQSSARPACRIRSQIGRNAGPVGGPKSTAVDGVWDEPYRAYNKYSESEKVDEVRQGCWPFEGCVTNDSVSATRRCGCRVATYSEKPSTTAAAKLAPLQPSSESRSAPSMLSAWEWARDPRRYADRGTHRRPAQGTRGVPQTSWYPRTYGAMLMAAGSP